MSIWYNKNPRDWKIEAWEKKWGLPMMNKDCLPVKGSRPLPAKYFQWVRVPEISDGECISPSMNRSHQMLVFPSWVSWVNYVVYGAFNWSGSMYNTNHMDASLNVVIISLSIGIDSIFNWINACEDTMLISISMFIG